MPFDNRGSGDIASISPTTPKSIMPFNNVPTIQDIMNGDTRIRDVYPHAGGDWSPGEDTAKNYHEKGDDYKRRERDWDILSRLLDGGERPSQEWKVKVQGGYRTFMSFELAQQYVREKKLPFSYISRIAQKTENRNGVDIVAESINKCVMVESIDLQAAIQETGSAFCVSPNKFITCAHVIKKYNKNQNVDQGYFDGATISLVQFGKKYEARIITIDSKLDLALLDCRGIRVNSFSLERNYVVGEDIIAIGSPHGFENNVSAGILGSLNRKLFFYEGAPDYMFVDASIFPGSSGCPIVRPSTGGVIGMVTLIVAGEGEYGLNAALPSEYIINMCQKNIEGFSSIE